MTQVIYNAVIYILFQLSHRFCLEILIIDLDPGYVVPVFFGDGWNEASIGQIFGSEFFVQTQEVGEPPERVKDEEDKVY